MKKFDIKKINWKKTAIIAAVMLVVAWGLSEVFSLHASIVTVKYVANMETYQSDPNGGYTSAISTKDKKEIRMWIRLYEEIARKGEKTECRTLTNAFPSYNIAFRLNNRIVQTLIITPERVGVFNFLSGSYVLEFENGNPYYDVVAQRVAEHESKQ